MESKDMERRRVIDLGEGASESGSCQHIGPYPLRLPVPDVLASTLWTVEVLTELQWAHMLCLDDMTIEERIGTFLTKPSTERYRCINPRLACTALRRFWALPRVHIHCDYPPNRIV
jgi:hypothetical protein